MSINIIYNLHCWLSCLFLLELHQLLDQGLDYHLVLVLHHRVHCVMVYLRVRVHIKC
jgi:hypothetical protein